MCLACSSQLCQYSVPTIDAPPVNGQSHRSLPTLHEGTCKLHAHVFNYPSSLNQCFLLPSGDFDTAASGVSWLKSLSYQLVPFLLQQTKWTTFQTTPPDLNTSSRCNSTANMPTPQFTLSMCWLQASICKYNTTYYSKFYKVMSTQSLHHHDYATVQSSIPWPTYDYHTALLGITWSMCISNHPTSDLLYTEHIIKYHPPNDSKLQYSPPLSQLYCPQSLMATLTQYSPTGPLQMNPTDSPGIPPQLNWCNCKLSTTSTCTYTMLSSPTPTTSWHIVWHCLHWLWPTKTYSTHHSQSCFS